MIEEIMEKQTAAQHLRKTAEDFQSMAKVKRERASELRSDLAKAEAKATDLDRLAAEYVRAAERLEAAE